MTPDEPALESPRAPMATAVPKAASETPAVEASPADAPASEPAAKIVEVAPVAPHLRNRLQTTIVVILVLYTCAVAEAVIVPMLIAVLFALVLAPTVRLLERVRIPRAIGSLATVLTTIALVGMIFTALATPARAWMQRMPTALARVENVLRDVRRPFQLATEASRELGKLTDMSGADPLHVVDTTPSPFAQALSAAPAAIAAIIITILLTFLFLLHGDDLLRKFVTLAPHLRAKRGLVEATRQAQKELSVYMITITLINAGLGLATAGALRLLGVADPLLWGGVAAILNYAPFIGPMVTAFALLVVGFAEFPAPTMALAPPAAFLGLHLLEGQLLTPHLVGHRLALDPVMVFLAMLVLGWMWGVAGLLLAVPLLTCAKIIGEHIEGGDAFVILLSR